VDWCRNCGAMPAVGGRCTACRAAENGSSARRSAAERSAAVPGLLWVVIAAFAIAAACFLVPVILTLRLAAGLMSISVAAGLSSLVLALMFVLLPIGLAAIARGLHGGSRVARGLAFVVGPLLLLAVLAVMPNPGLAVLLVLLGGAVLALLGLAPGINAWFSGPWSQRTDIPASVGVARIVVLITSAVTAVLALTLLLGSTAALSGGESTSGTTGLYGGLMILGALLAGAVAGLGFWARSALGHHDRSARLLVTIAAGIDLVVVILASASGESPLVFVGALYLHAAVVAVLWIPTDARRWFDDLPLAAVEQLRHQVVTGVAGMVDRAAAASSSAGVATPLPPSAAPHPPAPTHLRPAPAPRSDETILPSDVTLPIMRPAPSAGFVETTPSGRHRRSEPGCVRCGTEMESSWVHCPRCGSPRAATRELQP
jgi:hypothetical protein